MGMSVWYLIASLFLVLANGDIYDNISKSFYNKPESSSPKSNPQLSTTNEYILYLTADQAQALEATGAVVRPLPHLGNAFQQQQFQQGIKGHAKSQQQTTAFPSNEEFQLDKNVNKFYKEINNQQLNQALAFQSQSTQKTTELPKYFSKPRQEYRHKFNLPKRYNKTNSYSTEYVRYLPNYEIGALEMKPYSTQPLPGYFFVDPQTNSEVLKYAHNLAEHNLKPTEIQKPEDVIKAIKSQSPEAVSQYILIQRHEHIKKPVDIPSPLDVQAPVELQNEKTEGPDELLLQENVQKPFETTNEKSQGPVIFKKAEEQEEFEKSLDTQKPEDNKKNEKRPEDHYPIDDNPKQILTIERTRNQQPIKLIESVVTKEPVNFDFKTWKTIQKPASFQIPTPQQNKKQSKISPTIVVQRQYSSLLAPLIQHDKISESIAEQKDLVNSERAIQIKLQQIKESGTHNEEKYAIELEKLKQNLGKQNILAEKLATQSISKKSQGPAKEELALQRHRPLDLVHGLEPSPVIIPQPYPVSWEVEHPISDSVLQPKKIEQHVPIDVHDPNSKPGFNHFYTKENTPYLQEGIPADIKHKIPFAYRIYEPENLTILRPIWEH